METLLLGFMGGVVGWVATTFLGEPIHHFRMLRRGSVAKVSEVGNAGPISDPSGRQSADSVERIMAARKALREYAVGLTTFHETQPTISKALRFAGYDVKQAGENLMGFSNSLHEWSKDRHELRRAFELALRVRRRP